MEYPFSTNFADSLNVNEYNIYKLSPEQFQLICQNCSQYGQSPAHNIGTTFESALEWAKRRSEKLHADALRCEAQGDGYCLCCGPCSRYFANPSQVGYETYSGTVFYAYADGSHEVLIPVHRRNGFHALLVKAVIAGMNQAALTDLIRYSGRDSHRWNLSTKELLQELIKDCSLK